ncbi:MAG: MBL fold metallo-hydrolase [Erysipelotrichaceae bacterium]|nr:MBL fold metallo-hydrolase [Erysipelotrichaceae bacterium]
MHCVKKVLEDLLWIGADDRRVPVFEGVYEVPNGMSYNSYLLLDDKTVVFDTVDKAVGEQFFENLKYGLNGRHLDYLVVHHMEPDHAATIGNLLLRYPDVTIVCNAKIKTFMLQFFPEVKDANFQVVDESSALETGHHKFVFVNAPMVHWPEVMMSYDLEKKVLFSADAFGVFGALNGHIFADEVDFMGDWLDEARRYYTNIVGKYGPQVQNVLKKASTLQIDYVCPLHGFVWRRGFGDFVEKYGIWSSYGFEKKGVCLAYASVYGHTENVANILAGKLVDRGVDVEMYDTSMIPASNIISAAFKYSHLVLASTTYNNGMFVTMENLVNDMVAHNLRNRKVAIIENGSWAPQAGKLLLEKLTTIPGTEFFDNKITLKSAPGASTEEELEELANAIAADIIPAPKAAIPKGELVKAEVVPEAFFNLTYGLELLTTKFEGKDYGCIINSAAQVADGEVKSMAISVINKNYTCELIKKTGEFNVSVFTESVPFKVFEHYGFQSGRNVDKFADVDYDTRLANGIIYFPYHVNAVFGCKVVASFDLGKSTLFIADVVEARTLNREPSATYAFYHAHIKPKKKPAVEQKEGWRCKVCNYFYEGAELPADFVCPLCNHGPEDFEYVPAVKIEKKKGFVCKICGYFEPYEGDALPADYSCPLCNHGPEDFEPAEM